jgi:uncharacterized protein (TIGR00251 family)
MPGDLRVPALSLWLGSSLRMSSTVSALVPHLWLRPVGGGVVELDILVQPRASRSRVVGLHDGRLKVQLAAPPVEGAANHALGGLISERLEVARSQVVLVRGQTSRRKTLLVRGTDVGHARLLLAEPT